LVKFLFEAIHLAGVGFVIVAEEVEDAVEHEDAEFCGKRATCGLGVASRGGGRDGDVAEEIRLPRGQGRAS
jgi:hypothetical protein